MNTYKLILVRVSKITIIVKAENESEARQSWVNGLVVNSQTIENEVLDVLKVEGIL